MYNHYGSRVDLRAGVRAFDLPDLLSHQPPPPPKVAREYIFTKLDTSDQEIVKTLAEAETKAAEMLAKAQATADHLLAEARATAEDLTTQAEDLKAQAASLKEDAARIKVEAELIRASARDEGLALGRQEGFPQGQEQGRQAFLADSAPVLTALQRVEELYPDLWRTNEVTLVKLAYKIAERIALQEVTISGEYIQAAFKAGIDFLHEQHRALFRVNPDDLAYLEGAREAMKDQLPGLLKISFEPDGSLSRGDLVMETESGRLDATVRRRIDTVSTAVDEALAQRFNLDW